MNVLTSDEYAQATLRAHTPKCNEAHWSQTAYDIAQEAKALRETALWNDAEKDAALTTLKFLAERMSRNFSLDNRQFDGQRFMADCCL